MIFSIHRIFDINGDGFVDKREFKMMTSSKKINNKIIDLVFEVTLGLSEQTLKKMFQIFKYFYHHSKDNLSFSEE